GFRVFVFVEIPCHPQNATAEQSAYQQSGEYRLINAVPLYQRDQQNGDEAGYHTHRSNRGGRCPFTADAEVCPHQNRHKHEIEDHSTWVLHLQFPFTTTSRSPAQATRRQDQVSRAAQSVRNRHPAHLANTGFQGSPFQNAAAHDDTANPCCRTHPPTANPTLPSQHHPPPIVRSAQR